MWAFLVSCRRHSVGWVTGLHHSTGDCSFGMRHLDMTNELLFLKQKQKKNKIITLHIIIFLVT